MSGIPLSPRRLQLVSLSFLTPALGPKTLWDDVKDWSNYFAKFYFSNNIQTRMSIFRMNPPLFSWTILHTADASDGSESAASESSNASNSGKSAMPPPRKPIKARAATTTVTTTTVTAANARTTLSSRRLRWHLASSNVSSKLWTRGVRMTVKQVEEKVFARGQGPEYRQAIERAGGGNMTTQDIRNMSKALGTYQEDPRRSNGSEGRHCWIEVERIQSLIGIIREGG